MAPITDAQTMRSSIMEGKHAYLPNLPTRTQHECTGHAYCLPTDCLQDSLAFGHDMEFLIPHKSDEMEPSPFPIEQISDTRMCCCMFDINTTGTDEAYPLPAVDLHLW